MLNDFQLVRRALQRQSHRRVIGSLAICAVLGINSPVALGATYSIESYAQAQNSAGLYYSDGWSSLAQFDSSSPGYVYTPTESEVITTGGHASSYVDIRTGTLKAFAESIYQPASYSPYFFARGNASFQETIHIQGQVDGIEQGFLVANVKGVLRASSKGQAQASISLFSSLNLALPGSGASSVLQMQTNACSSANCLQGSTFDEILIVPFLYSSTVRDVKFTAYLDLLTRGDASADYSHTINFSLQLPSDNSYTSNSGVFLTAAAVPEPESYAMLLAGLGLMGVVTRRRTK